MRILLITQYFWPENFRINDIAAELCGRGHEVTVLTGFPNYPDGRIYPGYRWLKRSRDGFEGVKIVRVPVIPRGRGSGLRLIINYISFAVIASVCGPIRCRDAYDVIFVYEPSPVTVGLPAIVMRWLKRRRLVFWVQDLWPESLEATGAVHSKTVLTAVAWLVRFIYSRCDEILVQSKAFVGSIEALGVAPERLDYLPNSAESFYRPLDPLTCAPQNAELPAGFRVVFAGNIGAAQDFPTILSAAECIRDIPVQWIMFGNGRMRSWVEEQIQSRGLSKTVHLMGTRAADQMPAYFAVADVLLVTLRRNPIFTLTIPSKIQAYLACGRPVIAALDGEGARIVKKARAGLICPAENPVELSSTVLQLYEMSPAERAEMGKSARSYFEANFERATIVARLEDKLRGHFAQ